MKLTSLLALALLALSLGVTGCGSGTDENLSNDIAGDNQILPDGAEPDAADDTTVPPKDNVEPDPGTDPGTDVPAPTECDDGNACTHGDHLEGGACVGTAYACDDGKSCTQDACDGKGGCEYGVIGGFCLIDGVCVGQGMSPEGNTCKVCDEQADKLGWTVPADATCDDADACTEGDHCVEGACVATPVACDDQNPCTDDLCDPAWGCDYANNAAECSDEDVCTLGDICVEGECLPGDQHLDCDDGEVCTADLCLPDTGCLSSPADGACDDGNACTGGDACAGGYCIPGSLPVDCDDQNDCTFDTCDLVVGCLHELDTDNPCCISGSNPCDDLNPCTTDVCEPATGECAYQDREGSCNDGDACTGPDQCVAGACAGATLSCDDGNSCTTDSCDAAEGCLHATLDDGTTCDDGSECTAADVCAAGECVGDTMGCTLCPPEFSNPMDLVTFLAIGTDGQPGSGLDVDQNPDTCAPTPSPTKCSGGIDNQFASALSTLSAFINVNDELAKALTEGQITLLFEHVDPTFDASPYVLDVYLGKAVDEACVPTTDVCDYTVDPTSLTEGCGALIQFPNATITDNHLVAGGPGSTFFLSFPFMPDMPPLQLTLYMARMEADVTIDQGGIVALTNGLMGGAVRQAQIVELVTNLPDSLFADLPVTKDTVLALIPTLFKKDLDTDGDGTKDATSIGLKLAATAANVTGLTPQ
jgi:hypothetical protein